MAETYPEGRIVIGYAPDTGWTVFKSSAGKRNRRIAICKTYREASAAQADAMDATGFCGCSTLRAARQYDIEHEV